MNEAATWLFFLTVAYFIIILVNLCINIPIETGMLGKFN